MTMSQLHSAIEALTEWNGFNLTILVFQNLPSSPQLRTLCPITNKGCQRQSFMLFEIGAATCLELGQGRLRSALVSNKPFIAAGLDQ